MLDLSKNDLDKIDDENYILSFFQVGFSRGGSNDVGGPLWCDYDEFVDILGINQIFGHTPNHIVRHHKTKNSEHYCIDIKLNHYCNLSRFADAGERTIKINHWIKLQLSSYYQQ